MLQWGGRSTSSKRTKNIDDKESVLEAIKTTKTELITGPIDMTAPVTGPRSMHVTPNIYKQTWGFAQLMPPQPDSKWRFDEPLVAQIDGPEVKIDQDPVPMTYSSRRPARRSGRSGPNVGAPRLGYDEGNGEVPAPSRWVRTPGFARGYCARPGGL